jgi:alpha-glucosidase (family GH31 glycosyl hydrolase)
MWSKGLSDLYNQFAFDGIWIDMNEPYSFQTAEMDPSNPRPIPQPTLLAAEQNTRRPRYLEQNNNVQSENYQWYKTFD